MPRAVIAGTSRRRVRIAPSPPIETTAMVARATARGARRGGTPRMDFRQAAAVLKQASEPSRLLILLLLAERERSVAELGEAPGVVHQPALSNHLALMRLGQLVGARREGPRVLYSLTDRGRALAGLVATLMR